MAAAFPAISAPLLAVPSVSGQNSQAYSREVTKNPQLVLVAELLEVDPVLTHRNDPSLRFWYKKYNALNDAVAKMNALKSANEWELADIGRTELINLFAGRAYWHSHIKKSFMDIHNYKLMVKWLERDENEDEPADLEVWHLQKAHYTFKDLGLWKREGTLDKTYQRQKEKEKGKGKTRASQRTEKGRKVKPDISADESANEAEVLRKKKKSGSKPAPKASGSKSQK